MDLLIIHVGINVNHKQESCLSPVLFIGMKLDSCALWVFHKEALITNYSNTYYMYADCLRLMRMFNSNYSKMKHERAVWSVLRSHLYVSVFSILSKSFWQTFLLLQWVKGKLKGATRDQDHTLPRFLFFLIAPEAPVDVCQAPFSSFPMISLHSFSLCSSE